ncbi:receptor-like protein kinase FERONIA [Humulus lupulus]|uniref:receptor-like protein kinase FERONIA n=1 Tax=Humulus lupulus TaxID=3486 RepID=UPI002B408586|nr:receptor-like protein kinase FERONIA [Humulus lupulus]
MKNTRNKYACLTNIKMILFPFYLFLIIFHNFAYGKPLPYHLVENIALACGSTGKNTTTPDGRSWDGDDNNSIFFHTLEGQNNASVGLPSDLNQRVEDPYKTARLSHSEIKYTIPVVSGPKFIRLHFYASQYGKFDPSKAFFTVKAGQYTLLRYFSTSFSSEDIIVKEFCVTVEHSNLTVTFAPDFSNREAFAFVNGLEVVSMPVDLYFWNQKTAGSLKIIGQDGLYYFNNHTALETVYRLNVGGREIPPSQDTTGFYRKWEGIGSENDYLTKEAWRSTEPVLQANINLRFTAIEDFIAPEDVYRTARSMGADKNANKKYNLTWEFPVDSGFQYMVRLHFCEIVAVMNETGYRLFSIFISNQTAEKPFDVIRWSGGIYVPYYKDYIVLMDIPKKKKLNLSIALQANPDDTMTLFTDAILNGVEIFKLSDFNGNLAGLNPDLVPQAKQPNQPFRKLGNHLAKIIGISIGVVCCVVLLCVIGYLFLRQGRKFKSSGRNSFSSTKSSKTGESSLPFDRCRYFSLAEIIDATNNFEDSFIIGVGGFGNVYKGHVNNGTFPVAIKRLKPESSQGVHEFKTEIETLSHLRHRHLVSLIGYCNEGREMILVYEYMANGTLRDHLYNTGNPPLSWKQRLEICIGAAHGLHHLHTGTKYTIIHRDVKTTNILLDEKWVAKVSDFGLSKTGSANMSKGYLTTVVKGSVGYLDPEYYKRQQLTEKSDVYSFGIVLCEVLCGRQPIVRTAEKGQVSLAEWVQSCYQKGTLREIIDPYLTSNIVPECLKKYGELAVQCMLDNGTERPSMKDIVWSLEFAMQLQQNAEGNGAIGENIVKTMAEEEVTLLKNYSNDSDGSSICSWAYTTESKCSAMTKMISSSQQGSTGDDSRKGMSETVFSEITDYPNGR